MARGKETPPKAVRQILKVAREMAGSGTPQPELVRRLAFLYRQLSPEQRKVLFRELVRELEVGPEELRDALASTRERLAQRPDLAPRLAAELRARLKSPIRRFLEGFFNVPTGLQLLVMGRADILEAQREGATGTEPLEREIADLLTRWFSRGLLFVQEIDESSPYRLIRYLKQHEMVHPMVSLDEMAVRLGHDRRCFGLFHRVLPDEPVVFIEVALTRGLARSIHDILDQPPSGDAPPPDTAIFYSINSTQNGLSGLGLGKVLIFKVAEELRASDPGLKTFATLSPMPRFWRRYLRPILAGEPVPGTLSRDEIAAMFSEKALAALRKTCAAHGTEPPDHPADLLLAILDDPGWIESPSYRKWLRKPMVEIAHRYLTKERDPHGRSICPVANFHLGNGASITRKTIHFAANRSPRGLEESCGLMVNYVYSEHWFRTLRRSLGI
ncbi:MAG: hypothetical protein GXP47_11545 [Acidobacteria bacterium]|nr:hypothetical protein [Acidobacteriota bacterium]